MPRDKRSFPISNRIGRLAFSGESAARYHGDHSNLESVVTSFEVDCGCIVADTERNLLWMPKNLGNGFATTLSSLVIRLPDTGASITSVLKREL